MTNKPSVRPGWKTTEFWVTVAALITSSLLLFGIVKREDAAFTQTHIATALDALALIAGQVLICVKYLSHRKTIKVAELSRKKTRKRKVTTTANKEIKEENINVTPTVGPTTTEQQTTTTDSN